MENLVKTWRVEREKPTETAIMNVIILLLFNKSNPICIISLSSYCVRDSTMPAAPSLFKINVDDNIWSSYIHAYIYRACTALCVQQVISLHTARCGLTWDWVRKMLSYGARVGRVNEIFILWVEVEENEKVQFRLLTCSLRCNVKIG